MTPSLTSSYRTCKRRASRVLHLFTAVGLWWLHLAPRNFFHCPPNTRFPFLLAPKPKRHGTQLWRLTPNRSVTVDSYAVTSTYVSGRAGHYMDLGICIPPRAPDVVLFLSPYRPRSFAHANLGSLCSCPPRHHCLHPPHVVEDCTWWHPRDLLLDVARLLGLALRLLRSMPWEIFAALEAGPCAGSRAWSSLRSLLPCGILAPRRVFLFVAWVPHCLGRFMLSIAEPRWRTKNFR